MPRVASPNPIDDAELGVPQQEPYAVNLPLQVAPTSSWVSQTTVQSETSTSSSSSTASQPATHALPLYPPRLAEASKELPPATPSSSGAVPDAKAEQSPEPIPLINRARPALPPRKVLQTSTTPWIRWQLWYNTYRFVVIALPRYALH
jgi:hypothetical protein